MIHSLFAAAGDLDFDIKAYVYGISSILSQALYLNTLQRLEMDTNIGALSISYINSINSIPIMFLMIFATGDYSAIYRSLYMDTWTGFQSYLWVGGAMIEVLVIKFTVLLPTAIDLM